MLEIRRPTVNELVALAQLDREVFGDHSYSYISIRQFYDLAGPLLVAAFMDSALVGYGLALPSHISGEGWFMALGVRADCRGAGIGAAISDAVIRQASQSSIELLRLTVEPSNESAISLYQKAGFETEAVVVDYFGHGEDRNIMRRRS
jgi:ribosomal protein S18 acetylase RimI-like enzyme